MKKILSIAGVTIALLAGLLTASPAIAATPDVLPDDSTPASTSSPSNLEAVNVTAADRTTSALGYYEYVCVLANGNSYSMASGSALTSCTGTYMQKYLNGSQISVWNLTYGGVAAANPPYSAGFIVALASGVALVFFPPSGGVAWVVIGGLTAAGIVTSCAA